MNFNITKRKTRTRDIMIMLGTVAIATAISLFFKTLDFQDATLTITYLLGVMIVAASTHDKWYGIVASLLSVLSYNFFFTRPLFTFYIEHPDYLITFIVMFTASILISSIATKLIQQTELSNQRQSRLRLLDEINRIFIHSTSIQTTLGKVADLLADYFQGEIKIVMSDPTEPLTFSSAFRIDTTLAEVTTITHPLTSEGMMSGSFTLITDQLLSNESAQFTLNVANQISSALEKESLLRRQTQTQIEIREQRLRNSLLGAISHDLRTPLATIIGSTDTILENFDELEDNVKKELMVNVRDDAEWLIESVENILSFTRVEDGKLQLNLHEESIEDLFGDVVSRVIGSAKQRMVLEMPDELMMVRMDGALMEKVLLNLLNNAIKFSPLDSAITLRAFQENDMAVFEVCDQGPGIPLEHQKRIFERFYTGDGGYLSRRKGLGLGLSICKAIVEAHEGTISMRSNDPEGSIFSVMLPMRKGDPK